MQVEGENEYCQWRKGEKKEGEKKKKIGGQIELTQSTPKKKNFFFLFLSFFLRKEEIKKDESKFFKFSKK